MNVFFCQRVLPRLSLSSNQYIMEVDVCAGMIVCSCRFVCARVTLYFSVEVAS